MAILSFERIEKRMKIKFGIWDFRGGNSAIAAAVEGAGSEVLYLHDKNLADKTLKLVKEIFQEEFKMLRVEDAQDGGKFKMIVHCDADKHYTLDLEESELETAAAIITFIKSVWRRKWKVTNNA